MDSFEFNKIAGAALSALLLIFGANTLIDIMRGGHGDSHTKAGYTLPAPKGGEKEAAPAAPAAAAFDAAKVVAMVEKGNADNGQATFKKCAACHTIDKGGANRVGPNLYGVAGRVAGTHAGFAYSENMKKHGPWTFAALATFLHNPKSAVAGTKMAFAGVSDPTELADLLAYIRKQADSPAPIK
jgi:cytochrome c